MENLPSVLDTVFGTTDFGRAELLKCTDGRWSLHASGEEFLPGKTMLVAKYERLIRRWFADGPSDIVETADAPLPDVIALNAEVPRSEWGTDLNGDEEPPFKVNYRVYLINPEDGGTYQIVNCTWGAEQMYGQIRSKIENMHAMTGRNLWPMCELRSQSVNRRLGKLGPALKPVKWFEIGGTTSAPKLIERSDADESRAKRIDKRPTSEIMDDDLPDSLK